MADSSFSTGLLGAMDRLWFHHAILFSEPASSLKPVMLAAPSKSLLSSSSNSQTSSISEEENKRLEVNTSTSTEQDNQLDEREFKKETKPTETERERGPTRLNLISSCKSRSHSSSPSSQKHSKKLMKNKDRGRIRLQKTMSCKSLCELELEEVKGFMDLGFRFSKDHLSKRMMSLIPGLQRLEPFKIQENNILKPEEAAVVVDYNRTEDEQEQEQEQEEKERCHIVRPYLSEAWLIKRPDSPLLNLRIPRVSTASDMKKHLKYWAKTVATAIQQEP